NAEYGAVLGGERGVIKAFIGRGAGPRIYYNIGSPANVYWRRKPFVTQAAIEGDPRSYSHIVLNKNKWLAIAITMRRIGSLNDTLLQRQSRNRYFEGGWVVAGETKFTRVS